MSSCRLIRLLVVGVIALSAATSCGVTVDTGPEKVDLGGDQTESRQSPRSVRPVGRSGSICWCPRQVARADCSRLPP